MVKHIPGLVEQPGSKREVDRAVETVKEERRDDSRDASRVEACDYVRHAASALFAAIFFYYPLAPFSTIDYHEEDERAIASRRGLSQKVTSSSLLASSTSDTRGPERSEIRRNFTGRVFVLSKRQIRDKRIVQALALRSSCTAN